MRAHRFPHLGTLLAATLVSPASAQTLRFAELHRMMPRDPKPTAALAFGDLDGDGDLDAYVANGLYYPPNPDRIYLNGGFGAFAVATGHLPATFSNTRSIALGDVDGDGDLDVLVGAAGQNRLGLNNAAGVFADATSQLPAALDETRSVALGDVDGDGDLDAFIANGVSPGWQVNSLLLNDGSGFFVDATSQLPLQANNNYTTAVALGDVDGDGDLDALWGNAPQNLLYLNDGFGVFSDASANLPPNFYPGTVAVALGDIDGDGDLDAVLATYDYSPWNRLYLNSGSGVFVDASQGFPPLSGPVTGVALGDVDADGDLDVLFGHSQQNRLFLNAGSALFTDATSQLAPPLPAPFSDNTYAVALADVDGDADLDAVIGNIPTGVSRGQDRLHLNDGLGAFTEVTGPFAKPTHPPRAFGFGDVDADGDVDLFVGAIGQNRLYLNDGAGLLSDATSQLPALADATQAVALGDVDGDGDLDALIGNDGPNRLDLNDGSGNFTAQAFGGGPCDAVALADLDGDGDLDALIGRDGQNRLYLNDGAGGFTDATNQVPSIDDDTYALGVGDVDGDGDFDVLIGNEGQNGLWLNDGTGAFSDATNQLPALSDFTRSVALGDVDGDGDLDALVGNSGSSTASGAQSRLYVNDGAGGFADATSQIPAILDHTYAVALGDVDGDGDLDALMGNGIYPNSYASPGDLNQIYWNDGSGIFVLATAVLPADLDDTRAAALVDLDGDADLEVLVGNRLPVGGWQTAGEIRLLSNLRRQLAWKAVPRVGKPLTLDLYGPPLGGFLLAFGVGPATLPVPPFGILRLDPSGIHLVLTSLLDSQGRAAVTTSVPADPSLLGATVYWQALVTSPARFTNVEITTLASL